MPLVVGGPSGFPPLDQLKAYLDITKATNDSLLSGLLASVTLMVERYTGLRFEPNPPFDANGNDTLAAVSVTVPVMYTPASLLPAQAAAPNPWGPAHPAVPSAMATTVATRIPPARQVTSVLWDALPLLPAEYALVNDTRLSDPYVRWVQVVDRSLPLAQNLVVTGRFGVVPAPADIVDAVLSIAARRYRERDAAYGDAVQLGDGGVVSYFRQMPLSVRAILDSYQELSA